MYVYYNENLTISRRYDFTHARIIILCIYL